MHETQRLETNITAVRAEVGALPWEKDAITWLLLNRFPAAFVVATVNGERPPHFSKSEPSPRETFLMSLRSRSANFELSIPEDELEQDRILLEHNLQHTNISLHLSSTAPEDSSSSDVEYPRHNMGPTAFAGLASFDRPSRDHFDPADEHSYYHGWSYRSVDDDDGVAPDDGRTISTAAHHASALTLSAGLGGRTSRRDVSLSGAEYDPDRPLHGIIAGYGTRVPGFDGDSTKSKHFVRLSLCPSCWITTS